MSLNSIGSTSGDLIPQVELAKINLSIKNKKHFKNVFYAGSHDACLLAVINKKADICGMSSRNFEARLADGTFNKIDVRIIHKSDKVPPPPLAYSKKIPIEDRKKIKSAVLEAHKYGEIGGYGGKMSHYISVEDSDYDVLRNVVRLIEYKKIKIMLEIKNLKKTYDGGAEALRGVNLKIKKGEFISILGPSGSGKTTLLRSINGLEKIEKGNIYFEGEKITETYLPEVQKKTGMIFQEFNLVNNLSAINNVLTGLLNSSSKFLSMFYLFTREQKLEALQALETVGLLNKSYNRADELSGGQRQRVGIARAIIKKPTLLLADEPVASLDPKAANLIMSLLKKLTKNLI